MSYRIWAREESDMTEPQSTEGSAETETLYSTGSEVVELPEIHLHCILPEVIHLSVHRAQLADSLRFNVSLCLRGIATPFGYSSFSSTCDNKVPQKKKFTVFSSGHYCHSFHFMIIPVKNFLVWGRSVLKDDLL